MRHEAQPTPLLFNFLGTRVHLHWGLVTQVMVATVALASLGALVVGPAGVVPGALVGFFSATAWVAYPMGVVIGGRLSGAQKVRLVLHHDSARVLSVSDLSPDAGRFAVLMGLFVYVVVGAILMLMLPSAFDVVFGMVFVLWGTAVAGSAAPLLTPRGYAYAQDPAVQLDEPQGALLRSLHPPEGSLPLWRRVARRVPLPLPLSWTV